MDDAVVIRTRGLTKVYGSRRALDALDLEVPRGSVFGLLGENGAGKSTTIRMLLGLIHPSAGGVELFGRPMPADRLQLLSRVGCLVEGPAFYPYLSGADNLRWLGRLTGEVSEDRIQRVLERLGLGTRGHDLYRGYSTGMRQRLGIAAAILHDPELVILDEPLNGLDPPAVLLVRQLITDLARQEGKTVLISSHLLHEVELSCDRVAVLHGGRRVAQGQVADLLQDSVASLQLQVPAARAEQARAVSEALTFVRSVRPGGVPGYLELTLEPGQAAELNRALVAADVPVEALVPHRRSLEDLFHTLTGGGATS